MATSEILASGVTAANSSDVTVASGASASVLLKDAAGPQVPNDVVLNVQYKSAGGEYFNLAILDYRTPMLVLAGPGTYRVARPACSTAIGVDSAT